MRKYIRKTSFKISVCCEERKELVADVEREREDMLIMQDSSLHRYDTVTYQSIHAFD